jgi:protein LTV1
MFQEVRKEEQRKYGIDYEDDYDYMRHLKDRQEFSEDMEVMLVGPAALQSQPKAVNRFHLPPEVFASAKEEKVGMLEKAAPVGLTSETLRYGPEVHETLYALDDDFDFDNPDNELEDDFIVQAGGEMAEGETCEDADAGPSYAMEQFGEDRDYASDEADFSDEDSDGSEESGDERMSCFTGASRMTSATIRRNEGLQLLDEQFESVLKQYDDMDVGDIQHEDISGPLPQNNILLQNILREHEQKQNVGTMKDIMNDDMEDFNMKDFIMSRHGEQQNEDQRKKKTKEDYVFVAVEEKRRDDDCESIISTYSNLHNRPVYWSEPRRKKTSSSRVSESIEVQVKEPRERPKTIREATETLEEKKARKRAVKEDRRLRRQEKKEHKTAFKNEEKKQMKESAGTRGGIVGFV